VTIGQRAQLRFPAFDQRTTPQVTGEVVQVDADLTSPADQQAPYFGVRIGLEAGQIELLGSNELKPGMPAEAFIRTKERSPFSYLLQPLTDQIAHTFREG
jgi:multidrug efflux pump subunit AcrA (membrane-fusion protein)